MRKDTIKGLFAPLDDFGTTNCVVKAQSLEAYIDAVRRTGIWPLDKMHQKSNQEIIDGPGFVKWKANVPAGACSKCVYKLAGSHIAKTRSGVLNYWEGLCLDCMDISNPKTGDIDKDYWDHNDEKRWDMDCRIEHERNTWYFSYMGRPEIMSTFMRDQQDRKKR